MAGKPPVFTENFSTNLTAIETFLEPEGHAAFKRLLDRLFDEIIPILCRFPQSGRSFLNRAIKSAKSEALTKDLRRLLKKNDDLRECLTEDISSSTLCATTESSFWPSSIIDNSPSTSSTSGNRNEFSTLCPLNHLACLILTT